MGSHCKYQGVRISRHKTLFVHMALSIYMIKCRKSACNMKKMDWRNEKLTLTWKDFVKIADRPECILVLKALISRNICRYTKKYASKFPKFPCCEGLKNMWCNWSSRSGTFSDIGIGVQSENDTTNFSLISFLAKDFFDAR